MRLKPRPLELDENTGFDQQIDIFKRIELGERLSRLLESSDDSVIIGIEGPWGEGKSTFAKMLRGHLKSEKNITTIYFDAFENDYQKDPFLAITSQILQQSSNSISKTKTFKDSAVKVTKILLRGAVRVGVKTASAGALDETVFDDLGTADDISDELSSGLDKFLAEKLESAQKETEALRNFKTELEKLATKLGNGKPVTFIIDELDRCRPDYCIELIEQLKHLFTVKNLNFLIVTNRSQLFTSIKNKYGESINAHLYLQKFIDLWISLPKIEDEYNNQPKIYLNFLLPRLFQTGEPIKNNAIFEVLEDIFRANRTSLRGIEKTLSYVAILYNQIKTEYIQNYQIAIAVVCYCKAESPETLHLLTDSTDHLTVVNQLFPRAITNSSSFDYVASMIQFCLSSEEEKKRLRENSSFFSSSREIPRGNIFASVALALDNLKI